MEWEKTQNGEKRAGNVGKITPLTLATFALKIKHMRMYNQRGNTSGGESTSVNGEWKKKRAGNPKEVKIEGSLQEGKGMGGGCFSGIHKNGTGDFRRLGVMARGNEQERGKSC